MSALATEQTKGDLATLDVLRRVSPALAEEAEAGSVRQSFTAEELS